MKRSTIRSLIAIFIIALIISSCKGNSPDQESAGNAFAPTAASNAVAPGEKGAPRTLAESTIDVTLEDRLTATATIGPEGGTLSTVDANGTQYTLVIPEGALLYDEEISMTPLASAEGEAIGDTFLAGVRLEPDGLQFFEFVSLEITGPAIEEGAVGFTTQAEGQAFHLIPSTSAAGSLTLTTNHFSDPGAATGDLGKILELVGESNIALLEHELAKANAAQQVEAIKTLAVDLQVEGAAVMNSDEWWDWNYDVATLVLRVTEAANKWDAEPPGFREMVTEMILLVDSWFITTDDIVREIAMKCKQGEIKYLAISNLITNYADTYNYHFPARDNFRLEKFENWDKTLDVCSRWSILWQANVETTSTTESFYSLITLGAEVEFDGRTLFSDSEISTNLKVDYIEGFWEDICVPKDGMMTLNLKVDYKPSNYPKEEKQEIGKIYVKARIDENVFIDCSQGMSIPAQAQAPFHGGALNELNKVRLKGDYWEYELVYDPGDGLVAQFQEGYFERGKQAEPVQITWEQGTQKLSQLITFYIP